MSTLRKAVVTTTLAIAVIGGTAGTASAAPTRPEVPRTGIEPLDNPIIFGAVEIEPLDNPIIFGAVEIEPLDNPIGL